MAISIITSPTLYQTVYNPIYTQVSSTLTSQEAFSFIFDVYVNGVYITRDRLLPRPGTTNAIYSPARVLESYVSYDLTHNLIGNTSSLNCIDQYDIRLGEEYINYWSFYDTQYDSFSASSYTVLQGFAGVTHSFILNDYIAVSNTVYGTFNGIFKVVNIPNNYTVVINKNFISTATNPGKATWSDKRKSAYFSATQSGYSFNGVIQYEEIPTWSYNNYVMDTTGGKFLTKQPYTTKTKLIDRGSIGWLNTKDHTSTPNRKYYMSITPYVDYTPSTPILLSMLNMELSTTTNRKIQEFGIYPYNLNIRSQIEFSVDAINTTTTSYTIQIFYQELVSAPGVYVPISEIKRFEVDQCGTRFDPVRFMFINSLGQFDYYNATLLSRTTVAVSRDTYTKTLPLNYTQGDRGKTVINVNAQENYTISTDWVSQETAHWLTYEFLTSNEIYVLDNTTGKITPIILNVGDWEDKKRVNDKLLNYTITYSKTVPLNTRRN